MKILQINAVYGMGSTGKIVRDISDKLIEQGHESYVMWAIECCERSDKVEAELIRIGNMFDHKLHALLRRMDGGQGMHSKIATIRACKKILEISPDVVHLHNLHSNYVHLPTLLDFLKQHDIPTLITLHDCWCLTGHCTHYKNYNNCSKWQERCQDCPAVGKRLKKNVEKKFSELSCIYADMKHFAVNGVSRWTTEAAKHSILKTASHIETIYNWIDTDVFRPLGNVNEIKAKYSVAEGRKLILGVSQGWSNNKGLDSMVYLAEKLADSADVILVGKDNGIPKIDNLRCIGFTSDVNALVALYSAADVFVNPSSAETFGLVTAEAMACGTPVVAYDNSSASEIVVEGCGMLVEDGNKDALLNGVKDVLVKGKNLFSDDCRSHIFKNFEKSSQLQKYVEFYCKISKKR